MNEAIEPGDLVRVIRSHCPAAWAEEQGAYFVARAVEPLGRAGGYCEVCNKKVRMAASVSMVQGVANSDNWMPAAWLRKVPGLTADEVAEFLSDVLDETPEHAS